MDLGPLYQAQLRDHTTLSADVISVVLEYMPSRDCEGRPPHITDQEDTHPCGVCERVVCGRCVLKVYCGICAKPTLVCAYCEDQLSCVYCEAPSCVDHVEDCCWRAAVVTKPTDTARGHKRRREED